MAIYIPHDSKFDKAKEAKKIFEVYKKLILDTGVEDYELDFLYFHDSELQKFKEELKNHQLKKMYEQGLLVQYFTCDKAMTEGVDKKLKKSEDIVFHFK